MSIAALTNIEKTFGKRVLFDKLSMTIYEGERIGFIGANGAGKTTIFKMLNGEMTPDAGIVAVSKGTKIGYLKQDPVFDPESTVIDEAETAFDELHRLHHEMRELEHKMGEVEGDELEKVLEKYQHVQHDFDLAGGYAFTHKLEATLLGVGLPREVWEQKVGTLSGGQRSRLALAQLLIAEPDLLLLDEPTNHLDLSAIEWLEEYLESFSGAVIVISHDRYLLDRLATRVVWLHLNKIDSFPGNYSAFVQQRELIELTQARAHEQQQEYIAKQEEFIRRFQAGQRAREAQGRKSRLDRLKKSDQMIASVESQHHIKLSLNTDQRAGDQVLVVRELTKSFDDKLVWKDLGFNVKRGERIGIIGPNGSGKTTLLKVLLAEHDADGGELKWGANLNIGYYDQRLDTFDPENNVAEEVAGDRVVKESEIRAICAMMLFRGDDIFKPISALSGGERARVRFCQLMMDKPNVLVLDEPTNHLDIASCEALEKMLNDFGGTILCVSHDRYFLDRVARRLLVLDPPNMKDFDGNYSAWQHKQHEKAVAAAAEVARVEKARKQSQPKHASALPKPAAKTQAAAAAKDNPYKRPFGKLSTKDLERTILETETGLADAQQSLNEPNVYRDAKKVQKAQGEVDALQKKLKQLEDEYFARESE
jgi:ATP-binding cassette, subfamily F, member 3